MPISEKLWHSLRRNFVRTIPGKIMSDENDAKLKAREEKKEREDMLPFEDSETFSGGRRMSPQQVSAILNLSLQATNRCGPSIGQLNIDCMAAISLGRDLASAISVIRKIVTTASEYPELSEAINRVNKLFNLKR